MHLSVLIFKMQNDPYFQLVVIDWHIYPLLLFKIHFVLWIDIFIRYYFLRYISVGGAENYLCYNLQPWLQRISVKCAVSVAFPLGAPYTHSKWVLHLLPQISMFCPLFQSYPHIFHKNNNMHLILNCPRNSKIASKI